MFWKKLSRLEKVFMWIYCAVHLPWWLTKRIAKAIARGR